MTTPAQPTEREWEMALEVWGALQDKANVGRKTGSAIIAAALAQARADERERCAKLAEVEANLIVCWHMLSDEEAKEALESVASLPDRIRAQDPGTGKGGEDAE